MYVLCNGVSMVRMCSNVLLVVVCMCVSFMLVCSVVVIGDRGGNVSGVS